MTHWKKGVAGILVTCQRVLVALEERSRVWRRMNDWLLSRFMSARRSSPSAHDGGIADRKQRCWKKSPENFLATEVI